jgi:predicted lipoprotein
MRAAALAPLLAACISSACVPWTVRPIERAEERQQRRFDAASWADSIWDSRLLPAVLASAAELPAAPAPGAHYMVKGRGKVIAVDTATRSGALLVDLSPGNGRADAAIQIGPVIRGTSLRDAAGIVSFDDFVNQLEFADAANELNARVLKTVLAPLDAAAARGRTVYFWGTFTGGDGELPLIVPVKLELE